MTRPLRLAGYIVIGIVAGLLIASAAIWLLTRTDWGMERARRFAVSWLDERIAGELRLSRISGGGLLGGVVIHDFGIVDPGGRPFLSTDSLELQYDWKTLAGGSIELNRVVLHNPDVVLEKLPGDTAWNYEYVFPDTTPGPATSERRLILFRDARIINGTATVRLPLDPASIDVPADTARIIVERLASGLVRTMRFENVNARLDRVIWESPVEKGRLFDISAVSGRGYVWRDPFRIEDARGTLTMRDSVVSFDLPEVELASSGASIVGRVIVGAERNMMDIEVSGDRFAFSDLQWLYPALPDEGGGSLDLRIQSQEAGGTLYFARDARLSTPGTQLAGTFGVVVGDSLYFTQVDLRASPLDVTLLEQILPGGLPVDGLLVGTVEVSGPLSALETKGDLRLAGTGAASGSGVEGAGRPDLLRFTAALAHASSGGGRSTFDGGGTLEGQGEDMAVRRTHRPPQRVPGTMAL
ncbi:MAG: hypothetical protein WEF86_01555 [Gemmatimonadota bacterium]